MQQICLVLPVSSGRGTDARDFMRELEESRKQDYARSEERIGITKEVWYLAPSPRARCWSPTWRRKTSERRWTSSRSRVMTSTCGSSVGWRTRPAWT